MLISLRCRLFASYFIIILVGVLTLFGAASLIANAFFRADIRDILAEKGSTEAGIEALNTAFNNGVQNSLLVAALASLVAAIIISIFVSGRLARPLHQMVVAANRIASGQYEEKVLAPKVKEIAELAAAFNQMASSLEHNEKLRREMVSDLAHELRTPLTAIEGHMEGLIDGVLEPTPANFGRVQREARRLHRLAQELGTLSELDSPALKLKLENLSALEFMQEVTEKVRPQFEFKGIGLDIRRGRRRSPTLAGAVVDALSESYAFSRLAISRSRCHWAFFKSTRPPFSSCRTRYLSALPRLKPRPNASIMSMASMPPFCSGVV